MGQPMHMYDDSIQMAQGRIVWEVGDETWGL